jgi:hypothetical protein
VFDQCDFAVTSAGAGGLYGIYSTNGGTSTLRLKDCQFSGGGTLYGFVNITTLGKLQAERCDVTYSADGVGIGATGAGLVMVVRDSTFTQASSAGLQSGVAIGFTGAVGSVLVDNVTAVNPDYGVTGGSATTLSNITVRKLTVTNATVGSGKRGVALTPSGALTTVSRNRIKTLGAGTVANVSGIRLVGAMIDACVDGNEIEDVDATALSTGIYVNDDGVDSPQRVTVTNNKIHGVTCSGGPAYGVTVPSFIRLGVRGNVIDGCLHGRKYRGCCQLHNVGHLAQPDCDAGGLGGVCKRRHGCSWRNRVKHCPQYNHRPRRWRCWRRWHFRRLRQRNRQRTSHSLTQYCWQQLAPNRRRYVFKWCLRRRNAACE